jgi:hypothetical protein
MRDKTIQRKQNYHTQSNPVIDLNNRISRMHSAYYIYIINKFSVTFFQFEQYALGYVNIIFSVDRSLRYNNKIIKVFINIYYL